MAATFADGNGREISSGEGMKEQSNRPQEMTYVWVGLKPNEVREVLVLIWRMGEKFVDLNNADVSGGGNTQEHSTSAP